MSPPSAEGLCPACVLRSALEESHCEAAAEAGHLALPRTFGPYELIEEIGRGGMGVVYAARQPALGRTVAVKLLLEGAYGSEAALRRFQLEAAAAAGLQHPNIVAIHDFGEVDGQPYYAMDLVTGQNLTELCSGRPLPARKAAEFLQLLARAVHYAHQSGVLHRDLKPSNVLVDDENRPRITDFGLAKLIGSSEGATLTGQMVGSPSYAAPEQAMGREAGITVASDVYGLGALFYHLVTGRAPFNAATPTETLRLVLDTDPPPPRLLNPALPHDLETICLKCLDKEPARRYATAADLAEDVERFLGERPIRARPPNALYQMDRFARRHRAGVAATGVTLFALVVGLAISLIQYRRAVVQRRAADAARGQAGQLIELISHELKPVVEQRGGSQQLLKATEATVRYYESLPPELRTTQTDQAQADALGALGRLRGGSLHDFKGAEAALRAALALREKIVRETPDDPEAATAWLEDAAATPFNTASPVTEAWMEPMIRRGRELHARFPDNRRVNTLVASLLGTYAVWAASSYNKPREAVAAIAECQVLVDQLMAGMRKEKPTEELGQSLINLAEGLMWTGERARAGAVAEQALAYFTEALKADPGNVKLHFFAAQAAHDLADCTPTWNGKRDAERVAREHYRVLVQLDPDNRSYREGYATAHLNEFWYQFARGEDLDAAPKAFRELSVLYGPGVHGGLIYPSLWLAAFQAWAGKPGEARQLIEQTQVGLTDFWDRLAESSNERCSSRVDFLSMKAYVLYWLRDWSAMAVAARECLAEIEAGLKREPGNGPLLCRQADARVFLAVTAQHEGRTAEAIAQLPALIEFIRGASPRDYSSLRLASTLGIAQMALAESYVQHGDLAPARRVAEQLLLGPDIWSTSTTVGNLGPGALTLAASLCDSVEAVRRIGLADRAKTMLTNPAAAGRLSVYGKESLAAIARLRVDAAANLAPEALERAGRQLDAAAATDPDASEQFTRAGEATWDFVPCSSAISSPEAREAELAARENCRTLMARFPENGAYRFLFAETHRMDCYLHFGWDGQVEPGRAAFRQYDALLEPFVGRKGYESVLRTRLENSLHLAQLAASVGDKADAASWLAEAWKRFEAYCDGLPEGSPGRGLARVRFLEESAWSAWWLRDWSELARLAQEAQAGCGAALKEQPASEELLKRQAMADGFAALALAGVGRSADAAPRLQAARDRLKIAEGNQFSHGVDDSEMVVWAIEYSWVEALRKNGDLAQARKCLDDLLAGDEWWVPSFPDYWRAQKHLAILSIRSAGFLDPSVPFEAARRKELVDQASATFAPEKIAGRLTMDVQEALRELERLRVAIATLSP
ncbi:MAG: serine/threonine-protein kinase [Opitutaceae bacterium]